MPCERGRQNIRHKEAGPPKECCHIQSRLQKSYINSVKWDVGDVYLPSLLIRTDNQKKKNLNINIQKILKIVKFIKRI